MPLFTCYRCLKTFNQKIHLTNHLKRLKACPPVNMDVAPNVLLNDLLEQQQQKSVQPPPPPAPPAPLVQENNGNDDAVAVAVAIAPPTLTNNGGINIFIFPNSEHSAKMISSVDFQDINTAVHSLLGMLISPPPTNSLSQSKT